MLDADVPKDSQLVTSDKVNADLEFVAILALEDSVVVEVLRVWEHGLVEGRPRWRQEVKARWERCNIPPRGPQLLAWVQQEFDKGAIATTRGEGAPPSRKRSG